MWPGANPTGWREADGVCAPKYGSQNPAGPPQKQSKEFKPSWDHSISAILFVCFTENAELLYHLTGLLELVTKTYLAVKKRYSISRRLEHGHLVTVSVLSQKLFEFCRLLHNILVFVFRLKKKLYFKRLTIKKTLPIGCGQWTLFFTGSRQGPVLPVSANSSLRRPENHRAAGSFRVSSKTPDLGTATKISENHLMPSSHPQDSGRVWLQKATSPGDGGRHYAGHTELCMSRQ